MAYVAVQRGAKNSQEASMQYGGGFLYSSVSFPFYRLVEIPDGMSYEEAQISGKVRPVEDLSEAHAAYASGEVVDESGRAVQYNESLFPFYVQNPQEEVDAWFNSTEPVLDEQGNIVARQSPEEAIAPEEEEEELSPADELAEKILAGEIGPNSYFNSATGEWEAGSPLSPLTGGSLTSAPSVAALTSEPAINYSYDPTPIGNVGYAPVVGDSLLKGTQYSLDPYAISNDLNRDGVVTPEEVLMGENPFDPNTPEANLSEQLENVAQYPHLFFDPNDPSTWLATDTERALGLFGQDYYNKYSPYFGQPVSYLPEDLPPPPEAMLEDSRYIPQNALTGEQVNLLFRMAEQGDPYAIMILSGYGDRSSVIQNFNPYWHYYSTSNEAERQWLLDNFGVDGQVLRHVGPDYQFEYDDPTPWANFEQGELPQIQNPPPWHPDHNPRLDIMGRPITAGGVSWGTWLKMNNMDPETGIPVNPDWDGTYATPLSQELLDPQAGTEFNTFTARNNAGSRVEDSPSFPAQEPVVEQPLNTQTQQSTAAPLSYDQVEYEDEFGGTTSLGRNVPGMEEGALPPLNFGSGKGTPAQQLMPQGSTYVDPSQQAPVETPLRSAVAAPAEVGPSAPSNRGLFPRRM